jgi:hypothetical protein
MTMFEDEATDPNEQKPDSTTKYLGYIDLEEAGEPASIPDKVDQPPWRIELHILNVNVTIVFDFQDAITLGRSYPDPRPFNGIDLSPFDGYKYGISRNHATLLLEQGHILIRDLKSLNGTALNGKRLKSEQNYIIKSGDLLYLAKLKLRVRFLHNPFLR